MNKRLAIVLSTSFVFIAAIVLGGFFSFNNIKAAGVNVGTSAFVCLIIYAVILFLLTLITFLYNFDIVYDDNWYYAYIGILLLLLCVAIWGNVEGDKLLYKEEIINNFSRKYFVVLLTSMIPTTIGVGAYHIYMLCDRSEIDEDSKYIFYFIPHMFIVFIYVVFYLLSQFLKGGVYHTVYAIICLILAGGFAFIFFKFPNALSELFITYSEYKESQKQEYSSYEEQDIADSSSIYKTLETKIIPTFFNKTGENNYSEEWMEIMKQSILTTGGKYSTARMLVD